MSQRISLTLLTFTVYIALATEKPRMSDPFKVVSQELYVTPIPGYYRRSSGTPMPYPDQFYTPSVDVGTPVLKLRA